MASGSIRRPPRDRARDGRPRYWWWADHIVFDDGHAAAMGASAFLVYCALIRSADATDRSCPTREWLEAATGLSRRTVADALATLVALGYLKIEERGRARNLQTIYTIQDVDSVPKQPGQNLPQSHPPTMAESAPVEGQNLPQSGAKFATVPGQNLPQSLFNKDLEREERERDAHARELAKLKSHFATFWGEAYGMAYPWDADADPAHLVKFFDIAGRDMDRAIGMIKRYLATPIEPGVKGADPFLRGHPLKHLANQATKFLSPIRRSAASAAVESSDPLAGASDEEKARAREEFLADRPLLSPTDRTRVFQLREFREWLAARRQTVGAK